MDKMEQLVAKTYLKNTRLKLLENWSVQYLLESKFSYNDLFDLVPIGSFLIKSRLKILIEDDKIYQRVTVKINNNGVVPRDSEIGKNIGTKQQYLVKAGQFLMSKIDARNGAFGLVPLKLDGAIVTNDFPVFDVNKSVINPEFLVLITTTKEFLKFAQSCSSGTTNRQRIDIDLFLNVKIPLPSLPEQYRIVEAYNKKIKLAGEQGTKANELEQSIVKYLFEELGINVENSIKIYKKGIRTIRFKIISEWGLNKIAFDDNKMSKKFEVTNLELSPGLFHDVFRGKSPLYNAKDGAIILNQKCNRWNEIDLQYARMVDKEWLTKIDDVFLTQVGDILINSTGEGTIGRASIINEGFQNLLYDSHLLLLRLNKEKVNPYLFVILFNSIYGQRQVDNIKSAQTTKQTELGVNNLKKIFFPMASINIQNKLVATIKNLNSEIKYLSQKSKLNKELAIKEFEKEIFMSCD